MVNGRHIHAAFKEVSKQARPTKVLKLRMEIPGAGGKKIGTYSFFAAQLSSDFATCRTVK